MEIIIDDPAATAVRVAVRGTASGKWTRDSLEVKADGITSDLAANIVN